ncbi:phage minor tail protein L [Yersinia pestis]|uniref:phage minor tail protein L n=1 Tax=Yersinia pestis TaxID=632 RepID=UPI00216454A8|nr:phage minor tail protein L [Yersinia pestis]
MSNTTSGGKLFFPRRYKRTDGAPVVWQGVSYEPWPIKASGFDKTGQGTLPRPKIQVSNFAGTVSAEVQANDYLVGCRIIRKMSWRVFSTRPTSKTEIRPQIPNQHFPDEMWFVEQKTLETHEVVEFELSSVFDLMGVQLPYRQIIKNTCP